MSHLDTFHSNGEMEISIRKWLPIQEHDLKVMLRWQTYVNVLRDYGDKEGYFSAINELFLAW